MPFSSFGLNPTLLAGVRDLGFTRPTPIQVDSIPPALLGRDVLACAMTGSGKTAAFTLPILHKLLEQPKKGVTRVLVLSPTRELAQQIADHAKELAKHTSIRTAAVYGGVSMGPQERAFQTGVEFLVATPGRLLDHFQYSYAKLAELDFLVLDEADRMLDMGFLPDIRRVLQHLPKRPRQTLFFSATMPPPIGALAREMLTNPATLNLARKAAPATGVTQAVFPVREDLKTSLLVAILEREEIPSALIFTRTKHRANRLAEQLTKHGVSCDRIHGNRSQAQRSLALERFKNGENRVLVATDIAARGIDVEALSHVINLDVPAVPEDYIHRVGRTARAEAVGEAYTFVSDGEIADLKAIERAIGKALPRRTLEGFDYEKKPAEKLEIPIAERIAKIRAQKAEDRARSKAKAERKASQPGAGTSNPSAGQGRGSAPRSGAAPAKATPRNAGNRPAQRPAATPSARPNAPRSQEAAPSGSPWPNRGRALGARTAPRPGQPARGRRRP